jgi:hypothetical protein
MLQLRKAANVAKMGSVKPVQKKNTEGFGIPTSKSRRIDDGEASIAASLKI